MTAKTRYLPVTAAQVVAAARSQLGTTEHPDGSNSTPYGRQFGWDGVAWCAVFVWWAFKEAGCDLRTAVGWSASTDASWRQLERHGWKHIAFARARAGDVVFFQFDSDAATDHVGLVVGRDASTLHTIEGNTSPTASGSQSNGGGVFARTRGSGVVHSIWRPPYSGTTAHARRRAAGILAGTLALAGATGAGASWTVLGFPDSGVRTVPGPRTTVTATTTVDPSGRPVPTVTATRTVTATASEAAISRYLRRGSRGTQVRALQRALGVRITGVYDRATAAAVERVQRAHGLLRDGEVGPSTVGAIRGLVWTGR